MASADGPPEKLRSRPTKRPAKARPRPVKRCMALWWGWWQLEAEAKKTAVVYGRFAGKKNEKNSDFSRHFENWSKNLKSQSRVCGTFPHQKNSLPKLLQISKGKAKPSWWRDGFVKKNHPGFVLFSHVVCHQNRRMKSKTDVKTSTYDKGMRHVLFF